MVKKEFFPLDKPLELLDERQLTPYKVIAKETIENKQVLKELGTQDYIEWVLEDTSAPEDSPVWKCLLFVTYYGLPDRIPHVPEECYAGGGYQKLATDSVTFEVGRGDYRRRIPGRYLVFGSVRRQDWQSSRKFPVLYLFNINGEYRSSRDDARIALNKNLFKKYTYFSKIELIFNQNLVTPSKEEAVAAAESLLSVILPILEDEHWPKVF